MVPAEIPGDHPLVELALGVAGTFGRAGRVAGLDSWHDAASFTRGGTPCFSFGPDGIGSAHAVDESVTVDAPGRLLRRGGRHGHALVRGGVVSAAGAGRRGARRRALERRVVETVRARRDELVALTSELVALDTTARDAGAPPRDEARAAAPAGGAPRRPGRRDRPVGAASPPARAGSSCRPASTSSGRPQLVARLAGDPAGRSRDAADPAAGPAAPPTRPAGRAAQPAAHRPHRRGRRRAPRAVDERPVRRHRARRAAVRPRYERHEGRPCGPGRRPRGAARRRRRAWPARSCSRRSPTRSRRAWEAGRSCERFAERGLRPDAGLCAEPTEFEAWVACRGILKPRLTIPGRAGHSQEPQPGWRDGGAVNAIDKLVPILTEVRRINDDWRARADQRHPFLAPGDIVPVLVDGGTWDVTYPRLLPPDARLPLPARRTGIRTSAPNRSRPRSAAASTPPPRPTPGSPSTPSPGSGSGRCRRPRSPPTIRS